MKIKLCRGNKILVKKTYAVNNTKYVHVKDE
jgi:hypothetical protein